MAAIGLYVNNSASMTAGDTSLRNRLITAGHTVTNISDETTPTVGQGLDGYVIAESCTGTIDAAAFLAIGLPWLSCDVGSWNDMGLATVDNDNSATSSRFFDLVAHDITAGITPTADCQVKDTNAGMWGTPGSPGNLAPDAFVFAWHGSSATHAMGVCVDEGDNLVGNVPAPARRVGLAYIDGTNSWVVGLTAAGITLLEQAVDWMLAGGAAPITGTAAVTQANNAGAATGKLGYAGTVSATQGSQTSTATGVLGYSGTAAATQGSQTASASGSVMAPVTGTAAAIQSDQGASASGILGYSGVAAGTQADDTATASGSAEAPGPSIPLAKLPSIAVTDGLLGTTTVVTPVGTAIVTTRPAGTATVAMPAGGTAAIAQPAGAAVAVAPQPLTAVATTPHPPTAVEITDSEE